MKTLKNRIIELLDEHDEFDKIRESVDKIMNEDAEENTDAEESTDDTDDDEKFEASSLQDFLIKTETKVKISFVSCEPSPIFGPNDKNFHNKFRVTISNKNGDVWFYYWDSIKNTEASKDMDDKNPPSTNDVLACFGKDVGSVDDNLTEEQFKEIFGYDETESNLAHKAYQGCKKMVERARKLFDEEQIEKLIQLSNEY